MSLSDRETKINKKHSKASKEELSDLEGKAISSTLASETRNIINSDLFGNLGDLEFESRMEDKTESDQPTHGIACG